MSGLFDSLSSASRALDAQRFGLDTTGQNMANLNTAGYARRTVDLESVAAPDASSAGGGVRVARVRAERDLFIEARLRKEYPAQQRESAIADSLSVVETSLGEAGSSIDAHLTALFDAFSKLAQEPTSAVARDNVVLQAQVLSGSFADMASRLSDSLRSVDADIRGGVDQINTLASQIAKLNVAIAGANGADVETLKDQQNELVKTITGLADVNAMVHDDGTIDLAIGSGRALVVGGNAFGVTASASGISGFASISIGGYDITSEITTGRIGGLLHARDTLIPGYQDRLDQLAFSVVTQVNAIHRLGFDLNGGTNRDFFTPRATAAGAAAAMAVDPIIAANTSLVAASSTGAAGDNQTAAALAGLRDARVASGNTATLHEAWSQLVYRVGSDAQAAQSARDTRKQIVDQVERLRDQVSGVSLDEEAASMLKFQRAYEANAKFFSAVDRAIDTLMNMVAV